MSDYHLRVQQNIFSTYKKYNITFSSIQKNIFPLPKVIIHNLSVNNILVGKAILNINLLSFRKPDISSIKSIDLYDVSSIESESINITHVIDQLPFFFQKLEFAPSINVYNLKNVLLNLLTHRINIKSLNITNTNITAKLDSNVDVKCTINSQNRDNVITQIQTDSYNSEIDLRYKNKQLSAGSIKVSVSNSQQSLFTNDMNNFKSENKNNIKSNRNITANIYRVQDEIIIRDMHLGTDTYEIKGEVKLHLDKNSSMGINLELPQLDLLELYNTKNFYESLLMNSNVELQLRINDIYVKNNKVGDLYLEKKCLGAQYCLLDINSRLDTNNNIKISGKVNQNNVNSEFQGFFNIKSDNMSTILNLLGLKDIQATYDSNLDFGGNILYNGIDIGASNLFFKHNDLNATGKVFVQLIGDKKRVNANLKIFNFSDKLQHPLISKLYEKLVSNSMDVVSAQNYQSIRNIDHIGIYNLEFENISIFNTDIEYLHLNTQIDENIINTKNFSIRNKGDFIKGSFNIESDKLKPKVLFEISECTVDNFSMSQPIKNIHRYTNKLQFDKIDLNGTIKINSINRSNDYNIKDLFIDLHNKDNVLYITNLSAALNESYINAALTLIPKPLSISSAYRIQHIPLSFASQTNYFATPLTDGYANLIGNFKTHGNNSNELLYHLTSSGNIVVNDAKLVNTDLDVVVDNIRNFKNSDDTKLKNIINSATKEGSTTIKNLTSEYNINKGIINFDNIKFQTSNSLVTGNLNFDIYKQRLDTTYSCNFYLYNDKYKNESTKHFQIKFEANGLLNNIAKRIYLENDLIQLINDYKKL